MWQSYSTFPLKVWSTNIQQQHPLGAHKKSMNQNVHFQRSQGNASTLKHALWSIFQGLKLVVPFHGVKCHF